MPHYVDVPAADIEQFCTDLKFHRTVQHNEVVYKRTSSNHPHVHILIYTSIRVGEVSARKRGKDSIKVAVVFDDGRKSFGIGRFPRVHRTGTTEAVLTRVRSRLMKAAHRANEWIGQQQANRNRAEKHAMKNEYARREREQERQAFMNDSTTWN